MTAFSRTMRAAFAAIIIVLAAASQAFAGVKIEEVVSPGGIRAWLVEDYSVPLVSIRFSFKGGSTQDPAGKEGAVNLMTGLFDEGAGPLNSDAFQIRLDDAGAEMSFSETADDLSGSMRMIADTKDEAFDLLRLAVTAPRFDDQPFERIRAQIVSGIRARANEPETIAARKWETALFAEHPYARNDQGTPETLATITPDDLRSLHKRLMARDNLIIGVVGAISADELKQRLDAVFGALPEKADLVPVTDVEAKLGQTVTVDYDLPQTTLQLVYPGVARDDPAFFAAYVMNHILGGGAFSSRLYNEVREKRGLAYGVDSFLITLDHTARLAVQTGTRADRAKETLDVIRATIADYAENGPTPEELEAAKKYIKGSYAISNLDTSMSIAATLVGIQNDDLGIDYIDRREALIEAVTVDDARAQANKLLTADPALMIIGPAIENASAGPAGN